MIVNVKGVLLDTVAKNYEFNGKKGITYQLVIYSDGVLQKVKVDEKTYLDYKELINQELEFECNLFVNGSYSLSYKS